MVWSVDSNDNARSGINRNGLDNGNEHRPSDPSLRRLQALQEGMESPVGETPVDVKKENLRKIHQLVEQVNADIKYCDVRRERMSEERSVLIKALENLEYDLAINNLNENALNNTRHALMAAMNHLELDEQPTERMSNAFTPGEVMVSGPPHPSTRY